MRLEGLGQVNNAMTSSGIEPAAFRVVASTNYAFWTLSTVLRFSNIVFRKLDLFPSSCGREVSVPVANPVSETLRLKNSRRLIMSQNNSHVYYTAKYIRTNNKELQVELIKHFLDV
jgi:hypothetical protein